MILVDTSVWVDHLRRDDPDLVALLEGGRVLGHGFVRGEIACGTMRQRSTILALLENLPQAAVATDLEVLALIERHTLMGTGIGYLDAHLLAATLLTPGARLWTRDRQLAEAARRLAVAGPGG